MNFKSTSYQTAELSCAAAGSNLRSSLRTAVGGGDDARPKFDKLSALCPHAVLSSFRFDSMRAGPQKIVVLVEVNIFCIMI